MSNRVTRLSAAWLLLPWLAQFAVGCDDRSWSGVSRDVSHGSAGTASDVGYANEIAREPAMPTMDDEDAGAEALRVQAEECRPYTDEVLELSAYADDFPEPGPDVGLKWRPEVAGMYVVDLTSIGPYDATLTLLDGLCEGSELAPTRGLIEGWPGFSFPALSDHDYTFVIEGGREQVASVQLSIALGCEEVDEAHCLRVGSDGEPECGMRVTLDAYTDQASCMAMHAPGEADAQCPDTTWRGEVVNGCCSPEGECGHLDGDLGCHNLAQLDGVAAPSCEPKQD